MSSYCILILFPGKSCQENQGDSGQERWGWRDQERSTFFCDTPRQSWTQCSQTSQRLQESHVSVYCRESQGFYFYLGHKLFDQYCKPHWITFLLSQVNKKNILKDFVAIAGPLNVSHMAMFSKTDVSVNLRLCRLPRGPTLYFQVKSYTHISDLAHHVSTTLYLTPGLLFIRMLLSWPMVVDWDGDASLSAVDLNVDDELISLSLFQYWHDATGRQFQNFRILTL